MASNSIPQYLRKSYQDFSGGLNDFNSALVVPQNQFTTLSNALVNSTGILEKAKGYVVDGSPFPNDVDSFIRMLVNYRRGTSVDKLVCAALDEGNTNVTYQVDLKETSGDGNYAYLGHTLGTNASFTTANTAVVGVGTTWLSHLKAGDKIKATSHADAAYTEIAFVTNDTNLVLVGGGYLGATAATVAYTARKIMNKDFIPSSIIFNNNLVITNGSDKPMTYNNTSLNDITDTDAPKGKFIVAHKSRVFIAGTSGGPSSIFWSAINDETSWDPASFEIVFANDNGNICNIVSFADSLIVLKDNGNIYQVVGSFDQDAFGEPDFIRKIDTPLNIGTIAGFSAAVGTDGKLNFLTQTGVYTLDARMRVEKTSWDIKGTTDSIILNSGTVSAKSVIYDTATQWDTGAHSGTVSTGNTLTPRQNYITRTDVYKRAECLSLAIDSSEVVHVAYLDSVNPLLIKYLKIATDGTETVETAATSTFSVYALSIAVASNGTVGITWTPGDMSTSYGALSGNVTKIAERISGAWGAAVSVHTGVPLYFPLVGLSLDTSAYTHIKGVSLQYTSGNDPRIALSVGLWQRENTLSGYYYQTYANSYEYHSRTSGTWTAVGRINQAMTARTADVTPVYSVSYGASSTPATNLSFILVTNQPRVTLLGTGISAYSSADNGANWTHIEDFSATTLGRTQVQVNAAGNVITGYTDSATGTIKSRNHTTGVTSTIDATANSYSIGYLVSSTVSADQNYAYNIAGVAPSAAERFVYESATGVTNSIVNVVDKTVQVGDHCFATRNRVFAACAFGTSATTAIIRIQAFRGIWIGPEQSDSSISAWGTYVVTGSVTNGNTILHEVALNTISPPTVYAAITDGSVIGTDATKVFSRNKITFTMGAFAVSEIGAITMNYTGVGVGAVLPAGTMYDNEYYLSYGVSGNTANSSVLLYDKGSAWLKLTYPVIFMARYKGYLFGGSATTGKVYKLLSTYAQNTSAYTMTATTKEDLLGSIELEKEIYKAYVIYKIQSSGSFTFSYRTNNYATVGGSDWISTTIDQTKDGIAEIPVISGSMKSIQVKIESAGSDVQLGVVGWVLAYGYTNLR